MLLFILSAGLMSCNKNRDVEKWKNEILETEKEFAAAVEKKGITEAFANFAAEDVSISRGGFIIEGKEALKVYYTNQYPDYNTYSLTWKPDFVDVSSSGDLGYTYGRYNSMTTDSTGFRTSVSGIFHTVWKRQADGSWKFVWD